MEYFHGSVVQGLSERKPHASPFSNFKMPMLDIRKDGTLVFQEMFSGALAYFYSLFGIVYPLRNSL